MRNTNRNGFSLASLFLATAIVAVFLAAGSAAVKSDEYNEDVAIACVVFGAVVGICVGGAMGMGRDKPIRWCLGGMFAGWYAGVASGLLLSTPGAWPTLSVGSLVLLLFGAVVRRVSGGSDDV